MNETKDAHDLIKVLSEAQEALSTDNSLKLQHLSDETIHAASVHQDTDYIVVATIIYTLSKLITSRNYAKIKKWDSFVKKFNAAIFLIIKALEDKNNEAFLEYLNRAKDLLTNISPSLRPYVQNVLRKACINKACKIYEHGISLAQTTKLLNISQWDVADYLGQKNVLETKYNRTLNTKKRAQTALEFFDESTNI